MFQALVSKFHELFLDLQRSLARPRSVGVSHPPQAAEARPFIPAPLQRVVLTDEVGRTLFEEYAHHRRALGKEEETGWLLLGLREEHAVIVLATLPAGASADASVSHVRFNSEAQALASRVVRQKNKRLAIVGVVHTHPGSLRHPSSGDLRGDRQWVAQLRGQEGVFGIGTADGPEADGALFAWQPRAHVQCWSGLRFSWYSLRHGERDYRPLPAELTYGPDLARELHFFWPVLEQHANELERLCRQQQGVRFEVTTGPDGPGLVVQLSLAERGDAVQVVLRPDRVRYYVLQGGQILEVKHEEDRVDRGVYLLLAELAARQ